MLTDRWLIELIFNTPTIPPSGVLTCYSAGVYSYKLVLSQYTLSGVRIAHT